MIKADISCPHCSMIIVFEISTTEPINAVETRICENCGLTISAHTQLTIELIDALYSDTEYGPDDEQPELATVYRA